MDGFIPQMRDLVVGHEFMGIVEEAVWTMMKEEAKDGCVKVVMSPQ